MFPHHSTRTKVGIISGSGSFQGRFRDHFRVGDHFGVGIISGAVQSHAGSNVVLVLFLPFLNKAGNLSLYWVLLLRQSSGILQRRKKRFQGEGRRILARVSRRYSRTQIAESLHWGRCYLWTSWFLSLTPAFSVTCIGDIFVYLSTCFVTSPTSKC